MDEPVVIAGRTEGSASESGVYRPDRGLLYGVAFGLLCWVGVGVFFLIG